MHQPEPISPASAEADARWNDFVRRVHARLDVEAVGFVVVNDGRVLVDCDRAALLLAERRGPRLVAASGQEVVDRRSNVAGAWETFATAAGATLETLVLDGSPTTTGPIVEAAAAALVDVTEARQTVFVPILRLNEKPSGKSAHGSTHGSTNGSTNGPAALDQRPECLGWFIGERFTSLAPSPVLARQAEQVARSSASALANALHYERLPLRRLGEAIRRQSERKIISRTSIGLVILGAVVAALSLIQVELKVEARGTLEPHVRRHVFAPAEGVIVGLDVKHGEDVKEGGRLLSMRRPELNFELTRVGGELETERRRLLSMEAARLRGAVSGNTPGAAERMRLTAEEEEVRQRLAGLQSQHDELVEQRKNLEVPAPIGGRVLTWDVERRLDGRPVAKGRQLLTIGRVDGPWDLELTLEDRYAGYVRKAHERGEAVAVEFVAASSSAETQGAVLTKIAARGEVDEQAEATVQVTAAVDAGVPRDLLHPGAAVTAKIHCGRAAVGYVWLVDVIHFVRTRILF